MSTTKYEHIRIPVLKKSDYSTWKVKMLMFLEATDPDYIDKINDGPHCDGPRPWVKGLTSTPTINKT